MEEKKNPNGVNEEKEVNTVEDAIQGASDIIAENIADDADFRKKIKSFCFREAVIASKAAKEEEKSPYEMYYDFKEPILKIPSHRILAINRGEKEEVLKVKIEFNEEMYLDFVCRKMIKNNTTTEAKYIKEIDC